jgi:mRNA-degrading endonuclease RelE of RelBE toxin-antitoxin system
LNKGNDQKYSVELTTGTVKDLKAKACKPHLKEIFEEIRVLETEPLAGDLLEGSLVKVRSLHFSLKGSGQWRVAYYVMTEEKVCIVLLVGTRENFYEKANSRYRSIKKSLK